MNEVPAQSRQKLLSLLVDLKQAGKVREAPRGKKRKASTHLFSHRCSTDAGGSRENKFLFGFNTKPC
eukprot:12937316-Prorocentrum_lima.AAC.1